MKEVRELVCISCPIGCMLHVSMDENGTVLSVEGNACKRGEIYGKKEVTAPTRTITSTIKVIGSARTLVPVRTETDVPKERIFACMAAIQKAVAEAPVAVGDVLIRDVAGTGVNVIATGHAEKVDGPWD